MATRYAQQRLLNLCLRSKAQVQYQFATAIHSQRNFSVNHPSFQSYSSPLPDSYYNEEQLQMQATVAKIIETDINPFVDEWEAKEAFPAHQVFKKLGDAGLLGIDKSADYGGLGLDFKYLAAVMEELGTIRCGGVPMAILVQMAMTCQALHRFGSDELKKEFLAPSIAGDYVACVGVSAGSDVANTQTKAVRKGDDLIINGQKMWITNSLQADWMCLLANTSDGNKYKNKSLICVPMKSKGITTQKIHKIGNNCSDTGIIFFEDVKVPAKNIIGDEGAGFFYQMLQFQEERMAGAVGSLKGIDTVLSETIDYTRQRKAFGKSILDNQYVYFRLCELASENEHLRALTYKCIDMFVDGQDVTRLASMAKLKAGRLSREVGDTCLQFWGGMGYTREAGVSRFFRDARLLSIGGGADEIMLEIIAKLMNISPAPPKKNAQQRLLKLSKCSYPQRCFSVNSPSFQSYSSPLPDSYYNEEQIQMQATIAKIIETDINPFVDEWEAKEAFPAHQIFKKLGDAGLLGIDKSADYGGLGLDFKYLAAVIEELGTIKCGGIPSAISVHMAMTSQALHKFGSDELKREFLAPSIAGDYVACVGVSAGSDVASTQTKAVRKGDDLIINGQKMWITNSLQADWMCLLANTSDGNKYKNKSLICVPMKSKGIKNCFSNSKISLRILLKAEHFFAGITRQKIHKLGNDSSDTGIIFFEDVRVPAKNIIGEEGAGFLYQMLQFQEERLAVCAGALKPIDLILSETIDYTRQRKAFGKSILDNQYVYFRLCELASENEALRALTYKAIDMFIHGQDVTRLASMAKLKAGRLSREVGDTCLQFWGGMGYTREASVSRFFRDARLLSIGGGADEIMLEIIAKLLNISPASPKKNSNNSINVSAPSNLILSLRKRHNASYSSQLSDSFYNEDQKLLQARVAKFLEEDVMPHVVEWESAEESPTNELVRKLGKEGLLGTRFPKEYGGQGISYKYQAAYLEQMGTVPAAGPVAGVIGHTEICLPALSRFGSDELKREFLVPSLAGQLLACLGVSEPHAGSDVSQIKTTAKQVGDDLIINGQKMWITSGMKADWICLLANTSTKSKHSNKSLICVPLNTEGVHRVKIHKIGWNSSDTAQLFFDNVRVPVKNIIGEEGSGFFYQMLQFQEERLGLVLCNLQALDRCIAETIDYTRSRQVRGKSVLDNQVVYFRLGELATEIESLRAITYRAVDMMVSGEDVTRLASMAKLKLGRLSRSVADSCLQYWGGRGYTRDVFISRFFLDGRLNPIGAGADEIMLEIISKLIGISPSKSMVSYNKNR
ncbi:putative acyl-CoA dehydrogenase 6, partial [Orchesella cincta]